MLLLPSSPRAASVASLDRTRKSSSGEPLKPVFRNNPCMVYRILLSLVLWPNKQQTTIPYRLLFPVLLLLLHVFFCSIQLKHQAVASNLIVALSLLWNKFLNKVTNNQPRATSLRSVSLPFGCNVITSAFLWNGLESFNESNFYGTYQR
jgi:hypothetical protein